MSSRLPLVIVGNGGAAAEAVLALRASGYRGEIHLFSENNHAPYNPTLGPYFVGGTLELEKVFPFGNKTSFYQGNGVTTHLGEKVIELDPAAQTLVTSQGRSFAFERVLVASGAQPTLPPVRGLREALAANAAGEAGEQGRRVFTLRSLADALALKEAVEEVLAVPRPQPRAAVVGASLAGVKVADVFCELGFRVLLVERESQLLPLCAHPECASALEKHLLEQGYELYLGAFLEAVSTDESGRVALTFGPPQAATVNVDLVVICTGSRPNLDFLVPGSVETDVGILVDKHLRSTHPALYAAGDVAQGLNLLSGRREIIALWSSARYQGRVVGRNLAGRSSLYGGGIPHNITRVGKLVFASIGCMCDYDEIAVDKKGAAEEVRLYREGRLVGINLLNSCLEIGILKQAVLKLAAGLAKEMRVTWTTFGA